MRTTLFLLLLAWAAPSVAQDYPAWYVRGELGLAGIHDDAGLTSPWGSARVGYALGRSGVVAFDVGAGGGTSDGGFGTLTAGIELRAFARGAVSPYLRLEGGFMNDSRGGCGVGGLGAGVSVRLRPALSLRLGALACAHCGDGSGPVALSAGVEYRW